MKAAESSGPSLGRRVTLTLALTLVPIVGVYIPMPGIDFESLPPEASGTANASLFALGVSPLMGAYVFVEVAALLLPALHKLRHGFPDGRAKLRRWTVLTGLVLAGFQAYGVAQMINGIAEMTHGGSSVTPVIVLSAIAATAALAWIARIIDGLGLVNGFLALSLASEGVRAPRFFAQANLPSLPPDIAVTLTLYALPLIATWAAIRYSQERPKNGLPWLGGPVSSLRPVVLSGALLAAPKGLLAFHFPGAEAAAAWGSGPNYFELSLGLGVILTLLLSVLLQLPKRVARVLNAVEQREAPFTPQEVWKALQQRLPSALLLIVTLLITSAILQSKLLPDYAFASGLLTAVLVDGAQAFQLHRKSQGLVCVWEERRPYAVPGLVAAAERAGISLRTTGMAQTSMLRLFGSFAAIGLWCAPSEAVAARELLGKLLLQANGKEPHGKG